MVSTNTHGINKNKKKVCSDLRNMVKNTLIIEYMFHDEATGTKEFCELFGEPDTESDHELI